MTLEQFLLGGLLGLLALYAIARVVFAAYFRSKLDFMRRLIHGERSEDGTTRHD